MTLSFAKRLFARSAVPAILLASAWLVLADNGNYWNLVRGLPAAAGFSAGFTISVALFSLAVVNLFLTLLAWGRATRYVISVLLIVSAAAAWFMTRYGILLDDGMIRNVFETDRAEAAELLGTGLLVHVLLFGALPAAVLWRLVPGRQKTARLLAEKAAAVGLTLVVLTVAVAPFFKEYASMVRNHREIRYLLTPVNYLHSLYTYAADEAEDTDIVTQPVGADAARGTHWAGVQRRVVALLVVGETARADHFSLGGYERRTNPRLERDDIVYFANVHSCGTATAVSLPCMFSDMPRAEYSKGEARHREGLLDVLNHAGLQTRWLDNNSGCKGVCRNSPTWTAAGLDIADLCEDGECFDTVLLDEVERSIAGSSGDTVIVVHQNGSHGPAYYRRYPEKFRAFTPDCRSDELGDCTREEIVNSYDNTILYTDYFLDRLIELLESHSDSFDTALMYVSDHGESLGEYGLYLHGAPYFVAPEAQTRVPMLLWMSNGFRGDFQVNEACLQGLREAPLSHDYLFHSVLGLLNITTGIHDASLDVLEGCTGTSTRTLVPPTRV